MVVLCCFGVQNVSAMTEEDQLALALQMSLAGGDEDQQAMDTEEQVSLRN